MKFRSHGWGQFQIVRRTRSVPLGVCGARIADWAVATRQGAIRWRGRLVAVIEGHFVGRTAVVRSGLMATFAPSGAVAGTGVVVHLFAEPTGCTNVT